MTAAVRVLLWLCPLLPGCAADKKETTMDPKEILLHWISSVERVPPENFRPVESFAAIPDPPAGDSLYWSRLFFAPGSSPHSPVVEARHSYHLAHADSGPKMDLLRHEYAVMGTNVVVTEGVNFTLIVARPPSPEAVRSQDWSKVIEGFALTLLNLPAEGANWVFQFPDPVTEGAVISTNPRIHPASMGSWNQRGDAIIRNGSVHFICYKKRPQTMGFRHDAQWFSEDFRAGQPPR